MSFLAARSRFSPSKKENNTQKTENIPLFKGGSTTRRPLGFLSSNRQWKYAKETPEKIEPTTKTPITDKPRRLHSPKKTPSKDDLLAVIEERDAEIVRKDEKMKALNERLTHIQAGLTEIERERLSLTKRSEKLELEKEELQEEVFRREKEISALTKRCLAEAERIKENTQLRSTCKNLTEQVSQLQQEASSRQERSNKVQALEKELEQCLQSKKDLQANVRRLEDELERAAEDLHICLGHLRDLNEEKQAWETERRRMERRAAMDLEQQRVQSERKISELHQARQDQSIHIEQLEASLKNKETVLALAEEQLVRLRKEHEELQSVAQLNNEEDIAKLRKQHNDEVSELRDSFQEERRVLEENLRRRSIAVAHAEEQLDFYMSRLMAQNQVLQDAIDDRSELQALQLQLEKVNQDNIHLKDLLLFRDTQKAEYEAEVLKMEIEIRLLVEQVKKASHFESKTSSLERELQEQRVSMRGELADAKAMIHTLQDQLGRLESDRGISSRNQHDARQQAVEALKREVRELEKAKSAAEEYYQQQLDVRFRQLTDAKEELRLYVEQLSRHRTMAETETSALRQQLQDSRRALALKEDELRDARVIELRERDDTIESLRKQVAELHETVASMDKASQEAKSKRELQLKGLRTKCKDLEYSLASSSTAHNQQIQSFEERSRRTERERTELSTKLSFVERELKESHAELETKGKQLAATQEAFDELHREMRVLRQATQSAESTQQQLNLEAKRRTESDAERLELRERVQQLSSEARTRCLQVCELQSEIESQRALAEEALSKVASFQQSVRALESQNALLTSTINISDKDQERLEAQLESKDIELAHARAALADSEHQYEDALHAERLHRQVFQSKLADVESKLKAARQGHKSQEELEKVNEELRNKIQRQEAYMKRKLEKEKALRNRPPSKTPSRIPNTRMSRKSSHASSNYSSSTAAVSDTSSVSMDWEIESILAADDEQTK